MIDRSLPQGFNDTGSDGAVELGLDLARATELRGELLLNGFNDGFQPGHARTQGLTRDRPGATGLAGLSRVAE
jgi:hypothetical protein